MNVILSSLEERDIDHDSTCNYRCYYAIPFNPFLPSLLSFYLPLYPNLDCKLYSRDLLVLVMILCEEPNTLRVQDSVTKTKSSITR